MPRPVPILPQVPAGKETGHGHGLRGGNGRPVPAGDPAGVPPAGDGPDARPGLPVPAKPHPAPSEPRSIPSRTEEIAARLQTGLDKSSAPVCEEKRRNGRSPARGWNWPSPAPRCPVKYDAEELKQMDQQKTGAGNGNGVIKWICRQFSCWRWPAVPLLLLAAVTHFSGQGSLDNIKSRTVGDGQHGTARWATKKEIQQTYAHIPFRPGTVAQRRAAPPKSKDWS